MKTICLYLLVMLSFCIGISTVHADGINDARIQQLTILRDQAYRNGNTQAGNQIQRQIDQANALNGSTNNLQGAVRDLFDTLHSGEPQRQQAELPKGYVSQGGLTWMPATFIKNWADANAYCANTAINGQSGWRLPTKDELGSLQASGAMNGQGWTLINAWSSTPYSEGSHHYHNYVSLEGGEVGWDYDTSSTYVTCVL